MDATLISTKLHLPEGLHDHIIRPRLIDLINKGIHSKLTLIASPAGSGKTSLIYDWYSQKPDSIALAWLALDKDDNDPARFLRYLFASVQTASPKLSFTVDPVNQASQSQIKGLLTELLNQIMQQKQHIILALDDYHVIQNVDVHFIMSFFLDYMPQNMHIMMITRSDPPLHLARLRTKRELIEIRSVNLGFTLDEARQFLHEIMGLDLSSDQITSINNRTEGWIAGLQLAALSMRGRSDIDAFIRAFAGSNRYIVDYLVEEVFEQLDTDVQDFLLRTSIVDRFCAPLCEYLTKNSHADTIIEYLHTSNLFLISLDNEGIWYRYHHLFADLLRFRLLRVYPDEVSHLYACATEWCDRKGLFSESIHYAIKGKNWTDAANLIEQHSDYFWFRGELKRLLNWSEKLPPEIVTSSVGLCVLKAWAMLPVGSFHLMKPYLDHAETALGNDRNSIWYGRILSLRAFVERIQHGGEIGHTLTIEAKAQLAPDDYIWQAFTTLNLSSSAMMKGDLAMFIQYNDETRELSKKAGDYHTFMISSSLRVQLELDRGLSHSASQILMQMETLLHQNHAQHTPLAGFAYIAKGRIVYKQNDLDQARQHFDLALQFGKEGEIVDIIMDALAWSARIRQLCGQFDRAQQYLDDLTDLAIATDISWIQQVAEAYQVYQDILLQNWAAVEHWVKNHEERIRNEPIVLIWWFYTQHFHLIRAYIGLGQFNDAQSYIDYIRPATRCFGDNSTLLARLNVLQAILAIRRGKITEAESLIAAVATMISLSNFSRIILDDLGNLEPIIVAKNNHPSLKALISSEASVRQSNLVHRDLLDPLSEREMEVLQRLPSGLSNQEMAEQFYISVNTVKWHLKEIYSKLGVGNRTQAIEKARFLKLIS